MIINLRKGRGQPLLQRMLRDIHLFFMLRQSRHFLTVQVVHQIQGIALEILRLLGRDPKLLINLRIGLIILQTVIVHNRFPIRIIFSKFLPFGRTVGKGLHAENHHDTHCQGYRHTQMVQPEGQTDFSTFPGLCGGIFPQKAQGSHRNGE